MNDQNKTVDANKDQDNQAAPCGTAEQQAQAEQFIESFLVDAPADQGAEVVDGSEAADQGDDAEEGSFGEGADADIDDLDGEDEDDAPCGT